MFPFRSTDPATTRAAWLPAAAVLLWAAIALLPREAVLAEPSAAQVLSIRTVPRLDLQRAMQRQRDEGYDLTKTANGVRLQVGVVLELVRAAEATDPGRSPLRINHEDYYEAFLDVADLEPGEAPVFIRVAHEYGEDQVIDYRKERVVARVERGEQPIRAINVKAGWPDRPGAPEGYSYEDTESDPRLRVTHDQVNTYRILDFGDMVVYDDIQGIRGRATSGALGFLFRIIGDGRAVASRLAVSHDGIQVARTTASRFFSVTQTVTVYPGGRAEKGVPDDRPDLQRLARRLEEPLEVEYVPLRRDPMPGRSGR
jgi:hypothetical protein